MGHANNYSYEQHEIVKAFKSKLLMSNVLAERDVHKEHKQSTTCFLSIFI
jgi:hypothetical protein